MSNNSSTNELQSMPVNRRESRGAGCLAGLLLILLGSTFYMQSQGLFTFPFNNWWALFILVPALGSFERAGQNFQRHGNRMEQSTGGALLAGFILSLVALVFLFNFNWVVFGPLLIVLVGFGILINSALPGE